MELTRGTIAAGALALGILAAHPAAAAGAGCTLERLAELPVTMENLVPLVSVKIDATDAKLTADTGAFFSLLTPQSAAKLGLKLTPAPWGFELEGVNGKTEAQLARAKAFTVMGVTFPNTDFLVAAPQLGGLSDGLLGANFLAMTDTEFDLANGMIRLFNPIGCHSANLAYWAGDRPVSVVYISSLTHQSDQIRGEVVVNGVKLHAEFDTGTPRSMLTRRAAREAGLDIQGPHARAGGLSGGLGRGEFQTWIVPVDSLKIGDEEVKHTELRVGDIDLEGDDMLLGADFFLSHRVLVAKSQSKLYLTYNGGPVFNLENTQGAAPAPAASKLADAASDAPKDAEGYRRRGEAFMSRREYDAAIADFTQASALASTDPKYLVDRGAAHFAKRELAPAEADYTAALKLKPDDALALALRGGVRLARGNDAGAAADFDAAGKLDPDWRWKAALDYRSAGRFADAVTQLDAWIAANPKSASLAGALNDRCWIRALWGQALDRAEADCDAALRLDPDDAATMDSRGLVRLRRGELDEAIADYNASLQRSRKNAWSFYGRGVARLRKGLKAAGEADLAAAASIDPGLAERAAKLGITP